MHRLSPFLLCALILGLAFPAWSFETPPLSVPERQAVVRVGESFRVIPHRFGCAEFAWGTITPDGRQLVLKYIPVGADLEKWTRMMTVTVYGLPDRPKTALLAMESLRAALEADIRKKGRLIKAEPFTSAQGEVALFAEYETGAGSLSERAAAVFMRTAKDAAAFIQIQARGTGKLEPKDIVEIRNLPDVAVLRR